MLLGIDFQTWFSLAIGVLVSITLFFFSYRKSVGARRERAKSANERMLDSLISLYVNDVRPVGLDNLKVMRESEARRNEIKATETYALPVMIDEVKARLISNSFIKTKDRDPILAAVDADKDELSAMNGKEEAGRFTVQDRIASLVAIVSGLAGVLAAGALSLPSVTDFWKRLGAVFAP
ncbi:MAG: hypothetical protein AAFO70_06585 [Pseudomonadota bacterium]